MVRDDLLARFPKGLKQVGIMAALAGVVGCGCVYWVRAQCNPFGRSVTRGLANYLPGVAGLASASVHKTRTCTNGRVPAFTERLSPPSKSKPVKLANRPPEP